MENLPEIGFHIKIVMTSTFSSTIWDKSCTSYAHTLAQNSMSGFGILATNAGGLASPPPREIFGSFPKDWSNKNLTYYILSTSYISLIATDLLTEAGNNENKMRSVEFFLEIFHYLYFESVSYWLSLYFKTSYSFDILRLSSIGGHFPSYPFNFIWSHEFKA